MDEVAALIQQGDELREAGCYAEAIAAYDTALALDLENVAARRGRALALQRGRRPAPDPAGGPAAQVQRWLRRAAAFEALARPAPALAAYEEALLLDPTNLIAGAGKVRMAEALAQAAPGQN